MVQITSTLAAIAITSAAIATTTTNTIVHAHPGQPHHERSLLETANSHLFKHNAHRSLKACEHSAHARELQQRLAQRREHKLRQLRQLNANAAADVLATSHKSSLTGITSFKDADTTTLFGSTPKCVLEPEVTQGPYYVAGELIRNDIRETQPGIDLYAELQIVDINTCEPLPNIYLDFWHCNSTGVYAGVVASGNGDTSDLTNINATFLRGLTPTDSDGIAQFTTKFPGHYTSRATHIHVLGSQNGQVLANNTYSGGKVASVGQIFFDQDLISAVEATTHYVTNKQAITANSDDSILAQEAASGFDPIMEYVYVGDSVEDGIFAWISIGVDATVAKSVNAAATLTAEGGVSSTTTGGGGGSPPSGSMGGTPPGGFGSGSRPEPPSGSLPGSEDGAGTVSAGSEDSAGTVLAGSDVGADADTPTVTTPTTTTPAPSSACQ